MYMNSKYCDLVGLHLVEMQQQLITSMEKGHAEGGAKPREWQLFQWPIVQRNKRQHSLIIKGQWLKKVGKGSPLNSPLWGDGRGPAQNAFTLTLIRN